MKLYQTFRGGIWSPHTMVEELGAGSGRHWTLRDSNLASTNGGIRCTRLPTPRSRNTPMFRYRLNEGCLGRYPGAGGLENYYYVALRCFCRKLET